MTSEFIKQRKSLLAPPSAHACCLQWLKASAGLVNFYRACDGDYDREAFLLRFRILALDEVLGNSLLYAGRLDGSFLPFICTELYTFIGEFRRHMSEDVSILEIDPEGDLAVEWSASMDSFLEAAAFGLSAVVGGDSEKRVSLQNMPRQKVMRRGFLKNNPERFEGILAGSRSVEVSIFNRFVVGKDQWRPHSG